jgi:hypothetical protein
VNNGNWLIGLCVVVVVLLGVLVGGIFGVAAWSGNHHLGAAIVTGGGTCGGAITLGLLIINTVRKRP